MKLQMLMSQVYRTSDRCLPLSPAAVVRVSSCQSDPTLDVRSSRISVPRRKRFGNAGKQMHG